MELKLRTLTPLHVGDGSTLHSFDYVVHNSRFYRISQRVFENFLATMGAQMTEAFVTWSDDLASQIDHAERDQKNNPRGRDYNQELSRLRRSFNLLEFAKKMGQDRAFLSFLNEAKVPSMPMPDAAKGEAPKQEIRGFQRNGLNEPYLPGSSVKGSIRTALLYHFLEQHAEHESVRRILKEDLNQAHKEKSDAENRKVRFNLDRHKKAFADRLEQLAFFAGMIDERGKRRNGEAQDDLLKCLLVSDATIDAAGVGIENIDLYLVKKLPKGQGLEAQKQRQAPAAESLLPGQVLNIKVDVNIELLLQLHKSQQSTEKGIMIGRESHFIGWRDCCKTIFGLDAADFDSVAGEKQNGDFPRFKALREKAINHILECCRVFTNAQATALSKWSIHFKKHDSGGMSRPLDAGLMPIISATGIRFHLGFATGFEGVTAALHLLAFHKPIFSEVMELFGIGDSPSAWKNRKPDETYKANPDQFPKSRRLITRSGVIFPMGWLEWADDPKASLGTNDSITNIAQPATTAPAVPKYLRGTLKQGAELDGELVNAGNPGRFLLYVREDYKPIIEIKYPAGFKPEDIGRIATIRVKNMKGKEEILAAEYVRFKL